MDIKGGNFGDFVFPVVGLYKDTSSKRYDIREIYGTAFPISNRHFITAGHTAENAALCEKYAIAYKVYGTYCALIVEDSEIFKDKDVAILLVEKNSLNIKIPSWNIDYPNMFSDVQTVGYPFGLNPIQRTIKGRAFKGYVSAITSFWRLPSSPTILELSFQCPRGLSGAPIICMKTYKIIGIVIGNEQTEMEIYRETEVVSEAKENTYIKTEFFTYGVGICINEILDVQSRILNSKVADYAQMIGLYELKNNLF